MKICKACGVSPVYRNNAKYCQACKDADPHRHRTRTAKGQIIVHVDLEGRPNPDKTVMVNGESYPQMCMVSASYGREDGTSGSIWTSDAREALHWMIDELSGDHEGRKQVIQGFHFTWDSSILSRDFDAADLQLVHKAQARTLTPLCGRTWHDPGDECARMHRYDPKDVELVITEGGETDLIAWDQKSQLALAITPKRRMYIEQRPDGDRYDAWKRVDIHDVGQAFTGGLERNIDMWDPPISKEMREAIAWGKRQRKSGFLDGTPDKIMEYSESECVAAAMMTRQLIDKIAETTGVEIKPHKLYGSGSIAAAVFTSHNVPTRLSTHCGPEKVAGIPINLVSRLTYFGGLIDTPVVGRVRGIVNQEDINSAYPSAMVHLPCMRSGHGHWVKHHGHLDNRHLPPAHVVGHVRVSWDLSRSKTSTPPFNVRTKFMTVLMPLSGPEVWVPMAQYRIALARFPRDISCHDATWWVQDCDCPPPFAWMAALYDKRQVIKARMKKLVKGSHEWQELNVQQEAIKLVLNSCYGKLAQTRPTAGLFTNLHYASHITGETRAKVITETWRLEDSGAQILYQHTDADLWKDGTRLPDTKELGGWGQDPSSEDQLIIQAGLSFSLASDLGIIPLDEIDPEKYQGKSATRGCDPEKFYIAARDWLSKTDLTRPPAEWPDLVITQQRMISRRQAAHRGKLEQSGCFLPYNPPLALVGPKRDFEHARPMPGQPEAWIIPPPRAVPDFLIATLSDLADYQTQLARRMAEGEFDDDLF
jgi:DNA polymerase family B